MKTGICDIQSARLSYRLYGDSSGPFVVVEAALGASSAEWWHLAEKWSAEYNVLLYDRAGYGSSTPSKLSRTPENIARELNELLKALGIREQMILIGHSQGGLYAQQFVRLYPDKVRGIILLDPVSANNYLLKQKLSKDEFQKGGFDKSINLKLGLVISSLGLGFLLKPLLKKAPPFYYYSQFTQEAENYILKNSTQKKQYQSAVAEYKSIETGEEIKALTVKAGFPDIPLYLICHTPEVMTSEIAEYGGCDHATASRLDHVWISMMKEYLEFSSNSTYLEAQNSGHFIHLSDPDIVWEILGKIR